MKARWLAVLLVACAACAPASVEAADGPALVTRGAATTELGTQRSGAQPIVTVEVDVARDVTLERVLLSCGCTAATPSRVLPGGAVEPYGWGTALEPGERLRLELAIDLEGKAGGFHSRIDLIDATRAVVWTHHVEARVERALFVEPRTANFGRLGLGEQAELAVRVRSDVVAPDGLEVELHGAAGFEVLGTRPIEDGRDLAEVRLRAGPFEAPGIQFGELEVVVRDGLGAEWARLPLSAFADVRGKVRAEPARLAFGLLVAGDVAERTVVVDFDDAPAEGAWQLNLASGVEGDFELRSSWPTATRCELTLEWRPTPASPRGTLRGDVQYVTGAGPVFAIPLNGLMKLPVDLRPEGKR